MAASELFEVEVVVAARWWKIIIKTARKAARTGKAGRVPCFARSWERAL